MTISVKAIDSQELSEFWFLFSRVISSDFPGYSKTVVRYFLEKMYTQHNFAHWLETKQKIILLASYPKQASTNFNKLQPFGSTQDKPVSTIVVGFAVIDAPYGGVSFCRWLGVKKEFQKRGVGRQLIEAWINLAKKQGCHKIEVTGQPEAKGFYKKAGLTLEGKRISSYFGINQYLFGKVIGQQNDSAMTKES